ncbi:hypothetical protein J4206_01605, partial [Candidatus Woesearchaeota archaeon]|nr:hypothetical protein [Candidatus Woesearchaeota archaeon]
EEFDLVINIPTNNQEIAKFLRIDKIDGKTISFEVERTADSRVKDLSDAVIIKVGNEMVYIGTLPEKKRLDITSYVSGFCTRYPCRLPINFSALYKTQILLENFKQEANDSKKNLENAARTEQPASRNKKQGDFVSLGRFEKGEIKDVELKKYDTARFIIGNNQYFLQLLGISSTSSEISLLPAFESIDLELTMPVRADINNNELDDIIIILTNLDINKAVFSLQHLDEAAERERNEARDSKTVQSSTRKNNAANDEEIADEVVVENIKIMREKGSNGNNNNNNNNGENGDAGKEEDSGSSINFLSWIVLFVLGIGIVGGVSYWQDVERERNRERKKWAIERYYMEHGKLPHGVKKEDYEMLKQKKRHNAKNNVKKHEASQQNVHHEVISMFVKELKDKNYSDEKIRQELSRRGWDPREVQHVIKTQESKQVYSNIDSLVAFAEDALSRGYKIDQITKSLHQKGWPKEIIVKVFREEKRLRKYLR